MTDRLNPSEITNVDSIIERLKSFKEITEPEVKFITEKAIEILVN